MKSKIVYSRATVDFVLAYKDEDDFFREKRLFWEDWIIARVDITNAYEKEGEDNLKVWKKVNGVWK